MMLNMLVFAVAAAGGVGTGILPEAAFAGEAAKAEDNSVRMKRVRVRVEGVSLSGLFAHFVDGSRLFTEVPVEAEADGSAFLALEPNCLVYIGN